MSNGIEDDARFPLVIARGKNLLRLPDVEHVMWNAFPFLRSSFCRTDVEIAKDLDGIVVHDLPIEAFGDRKSQVRLAAGGRPDDGNDRMQGRFQYILWISIPW